MAYHLLSSQFCLLISYDQEMLYLFCCNQLFARKIKYENNTSTIPIELEKVDTKEIITPKGAVLTMFN